MAMQKKTLAYWGGLLMTAVGLYGACGDTVSGSNCKVRCQDVDNTCVQKCTDDQCKTVCKTDLDNCSASCDTIAIMKPDGGG
jgi:hypothetical protein